MGTLIKSESGELISLLYSKDGNLTIPKPFERDIFLFDTHVAGTNYSNFTNGGPYPQSLSQSLTPCSWTTKTKTAITPWTE